MDGNDGSIIEEASEAIVDLVTLEEETRKTKEEEKTLTRTSGGENSWDKVMFALQEVAKTMEEFMGEGTDTLEVKLAPTVEERKHTPPKNARELAMIRRDDLQKLQVIDRIKLMGEICFRYREEQVVTSEEKVEHITESLEEVIYMDSQDKADYVDVRADSSQGHRHLHDTKLNEYLAQTLCQVEVTKSVAQAPGQRVHQAPGQRVHHVEDIRYNSIGSTQVVQWDPGDKNSIFAGRESTL